MKIALDAMGGDFAPRSAVEGAVMVLSSLPDDMGIVLVGDQDQVNSLLDELEADRSRIEVVHAASVIGMNEHPTKALTQKPDSSIAIGYGLLKQKAVDAFASAGSTGAMLVGAMFTVKAIEGIIRPAIASHVPKEKGTYGVILDVGANADCKPDVLMQFAEMGSLYAKHVLNIDKPKVGLMNLGEEEQKGTMVTQAAYQLMKMSNKIDFYGNIEGRDLFNDKADVVVCDGFTGNVVLKLSEQFYNILERRNLRDPFIDKFNYEDIGGSPILGVNANVVIGHGVSSALAVKNMLLQTASMAESNMHSEIRKALS